MEKIKKYAPFVFFFIASAFLFYKCFLGYSIQGVDTGLWTTIFYRNAKETPFFWNNLFWLGMSSGSFIFGIYYVIAQLVPLGMVLPITYFLSVFLSMIFFYLLTGKFNLSKPSRIFGALSYGFLPPVISLIYSGHIQVVEFLLYMPLIFLCIEEIFSNKKNILRKIFFFGIISIAWGLIVTNDVQRGFYFTIVSVIYIIFKILDSENKKLEKLFISTSFYKKLGLLILIGLSAILVFSNSLPTWIEILKGRSALQENVKTQSEEEKFEFSSSWSLHPLELIDSIAFGFHGMISQDPKGPYWGEKPFSGNSEALGFFTTFFAIMGIILTYKKNKYTKFFFWAGLILTLLSFGRYWPGKPLFWLFYKLPLMSNFRAPAKFFSIAAFFFSLLAAIGFENLFNILMDKNKKLFAKNIIFTMFAFIGIVLFAIFITMITSEDLSSSLYNKLYRDFRFVDTAIKNIFISLLRLIVFLTITTITIYLVNSNKYKKESLIYFLVFITFSFFDLFSINNFYISRSYFKEKEHYKKDKVTEFLYNENKKEVFRTATSFFIPSLNRSVSYPMTGLKGYYLTYHFPYYGIETLDIPAISTVYPDYENFFLSTLKSQIKGEIKDLNAALELNSRLFELGNVKYVLIDIEVDSSYLILTNVLKALNGKDIYVYYNKNYMPRLSFYEGYVNIKNEGEVLELLASKDFDVTKSVIINFSDLPETETEGKEREKVEILEYKGWKYRAKVNALNDGVLVGSFKYEKDNWKAKIDGEKTKTFPVNYLLTGVFVPKGEHTIEIYYEQSKLFYFISVIAIVIFALMIAFSGIFYLLEVKKGERKL